MKPRKKGRFPDLSPWRALLLLTALLVLFSSGCQNVVHYTYSDTLPPAEGDVTVPGIEVGATISRDSMGIPFIESEDMDDCAFANGYADASDRLAQMVGQSLVAQGRLSEMLGEDVLSIDVFMRTLDLKSRADRAYNQAAPEIRRLLASYAAGVNAYLWTHQDKLPMDLSISGYHPDPWRPVDSYYVFYLLSAGLATNLKEELGYLTVAGAVGPEKAAWLAPIYPDEPIPLAEARKLYGVDLMALENETRTVARAMEKVLSVTTLGAAASNNWALHKSRTAGGASIIANDTHLPISLPSLWTLSHVRCPGKYDVAGVSAPGLPGVIIGTNGKMAWGITMVMADTQDVFLEKLTTIKGKRHYLYKDKWLPTREREEVFRVRGGKPVSIVIHETVHGPLLNQALKDVSKHLLVPEPVESQYGLAVSWAERDEDKTFDGFLQLSTAQTMEQARDALKKVQGMGFNMVYGNKDNIAWQVTGTYPLRKKGRGLFPSPGWNGEYDWDGFLAFEDYPHAVNPKDGFLATANNRTVPRDFPFVLSSSWFNPERAQRLHRVLPLEHRSTEKRSFDLQYDQVSNMVPKIQRLYFNSPYTDQINLLINNFPNPQKRKRAREAAEMLRRFDGHMSADSRSAIIVPAIMQCFTVNTFADELGPTDGPLWASFLEMGTMSYAAWDDHLLVRGDESPFFDNVKTDKKETKAEILADTLADALELLEQKLGKDRRDWKWGALHKYYFETEATHLAPHLQALKRLGVRFLSGYFNAGPFPAGGDYTTLNVSGYTPGKSFKTWFIPEMRMVVDFSQEEPLFVMNSTGQSGNPASPHYEDGIRDWLDGKYNHMPFGEEAIRKKYTEVLNLLPKY